MYHDDKRQREPNYWKATAWALAAIGVLAAAVILRFVTL